MLFRTRGSTDSQGTILVYQTQEMNCHFSLSKRKGCLWLVMVICGGGVLQTWVCVVFSKKVCDSWVRLEPAGVVRGIYRPDVLIWRSRFLIASSRLSALVTRDCKPSCGVVYQLTLLKLIKKPPAPVGVHFLCNIQKSLEWKFCFKGKISVKEVADVVGGLFFSPRSL